MQSTEKFACEICGEVVLRTKSRIKNHIYCSHSCAAKGRVTGPFNSAAENRKTWRLRNKEKSNECYRIYHTKNRQTRQSYVKDWRKQNVEKVKVYETRTNIARRLKIISQAVPINLIEARIYLQKLKNLVKEKV